MVDCSNCHWLQDAKQYIYGVLLRKQQLLADIGINFAAPRSISDKHSCKMPARRRRKVGISPYGARSSLNIVEMQSGTAQIKPRRAALQSLGAARARPEVGKMGPEISQSGPEVVHLKTEIGMAKPEVGQLKAEVDQSGPRGHVLWLVLSVVTGVVVCSLCVVGVTRYFKQLHDNWMFFSGIQVTAFIIF